MRAEAGTRPVRLAILVGALGVVFGDIYITAGAAEYFGLPLARTVVMGSRIEV
ncbi:MAG: hypothetical protein ACM4D3_24255 [Candidatus Sericytochromatia bacterium]